MGTKSNRSSGTQITQRGVNQGNVLVGPQSGLPIDEVVDSGGIRRLAVDANVTLSNAQINVDLDYTDDSVSIGDATTNNTLTIESDGSINTNVEVDAADGDNIAISDGTNTLVINTDGSINVNVNSATNPVINNTTAILANTEYSYVFPNNTTKFKLKARGNAKLKLAFISGNTSTEFITVFPGSVYEEKQLKLTSVTVYFESNKANEVVEIYSWN